MENLNPPEKCPACGGQITEKKGVSQKTGKPYHFWSCSNYPKCDYSWRPPSRQDNQHEEVMAALREIYKEIAAQKKEFKDFVKIFGDKTQ